MPKMAAGALPRLAVLPVMTLLWLTAAGPCRRDPTGHSAAAAVAGGREFHVRADGRSDGDGSAERPWDLATALAHPAAVAPGDTIWVRGGVYRGNFRSSLRGEPGSPILVRAYPGERATLDGGESERAVLSVSGGWATYWGLEVTAQPRTRQTPFPGSFPEGLAMPDGVVTGPDRTPGLRFVNLLVHDLRQGLALFEAAPDAEVTGCLVWGNGWEGPGGVQGHGLYIQNREGAKRIRDNLVFFNFSHGLHAYGEAGALDRIAVERNAFFQNGILRDPAGGRNFLLGGAQVAQSPSIVENVVSSSLVPLDRPASSFDVGYDAGCANPRIVDNYVADNMFFVNCTSGATITGNTFYGLLQGLDPRLFPQNAYLSERPTQTRVLLRPNPEDPQRATLIVLNWAGSESVAVDLSPWLTQGTAFRVLAATDYFGPPVLTGTWSGAPVAIPLRDLVERPLAGWSLPLPSPDPLFAAFVLEATAPARVAPARPGRSDPRAPVTVPSRPPTAP
jgi:hypothetical protein